MPKPDRSRNLHFMAMLAGMPLLMAVETAVALEFELPLMCKPGVDCWIPRYVDHDPSDGAMDYACGHLVGDDHKGTDFAIPHLAAMREGVPVLAAAAGVVRAVRDGIPDINVRDADPAEIANRECGNGIVITHTDGFETQYCHLRQGSVLVAAGDEVAVGEQIGLVGLSGDTSFPHVHLAIRQDGVVIDPFVGLSQTTVKDRCGIGEAPLWQASLMPGMEYQSIVLRNAGFADKGLKWDHINNGVLDQPPTTVDIPALVFALDGFHLLQGDEINIHLRGPNGWEHKSSEVAKKSLGDFMRFTGRKAPPEGFAAGRYEAVVRIEREGLGTIAEIERQIDLN